MRDDAGRRWRTRRRRENARHRDFQQRATDTKGRKQPAKKAPTSRAKPANKLKNAPADNNSKARDDTGPASASEAERLRSRVEELQGDKRRLEMKVAGLGSEVEEAEGRRQAPTGEQDSVPLLDLP